jgi:hypothetical protein
VPDVDLWEWWAPEEWSSTFSTGPPPTLTPPTPPTPFPQAIADTSVELLLAGTWTDITSLVYERDRIEIARGRANEAGLADFSSGRLTLNNRDGKFSPRNPRSAYYGLIGRNTQLRVSTRPHLQVGALLDVVDTFTRTVSDTNWGLSDSGPSWVPAGTNHSNFQYAVSGGKALVALYNNNTTTGCYLDDGAGGPSWVDFDAAVTFAVDQATGASIIACGMAGHLDTSAGTTGPYIEVLVTTANTVQIKAFTYASAQIGATATVPALVHAGAGTPLRVRFRTAGRHLLVRVWDPAGAEPTTWHGVWEDTTRAFDPGSLFLFAGPTAGNTNAKPIVLSFDDLFVEAVEPRFCGEVASWPSRWEHHGLDVWVPIQANGILRRLGQGSSPVRSPMVRFVLARQAEGTGGQPVAYWPLEDGQLATQGAALVGAHPMQVFAGFSPDTVGTHLGQGALAPWLPAAVSFTPNAGELFGYVDTPAAWLPADGWALDWMRTGSESASESAMIVRTASMQWDVRFNPNTLLAKVTSPDAVSHTNPIAASFFSPAGPHHVRFECRQSGANIQYDLFVDGASYISTTYAAHTLEFPQYVDYQDLLQHSTDLAIGHIVVWDHAPEPGGAATTTPAVADAVDAAGGYDAEPAATRIVRICAEEGIALRIPGSPLLDLTTSYPCGVQRTATALDLLRAAEATDGGVLFEPRDFVGLTYRMRSQIICQTSVLDLDYTTDGHLAHPLDPADDDQLTRNDVTVNRRFGQSAQAELATGALSTQEPPAGVGRYDTSVDLDLATDAAAAEQAAWRVHLGTVDEARYPRLNLNLAHTGSHGLAALLGQMARTDVADRLTVDSLPGYAGGLPAADQLAQGFEETLNGFEWRIGVNCSPATPWAIATVESNDRYCFRLETDGSTLNGAHSDSATSLSVASAGIVWTDSATYPADFPFDVNINGVRITVTAIVGTASPQTFTVLRSVDGFDVALPSGATVRLWNPVYLGLG